jgi:hypothetical protein
MSQPKPNLVAATAANNNAAGKLGGKLLAIAGRIPPAEGEDKEMTPPTADPIEDDLTIEAVLKILVDADVQFFCNENGIAFANIPWNAPTAHWECVPLKSRKFRQRLKGVVLQKCNVRMSASLLKQIIQELELLAEEGQPVYLCNRVAAAADGIHIDMGDETWRSLHLTRDGFRPVQEKGPRFYRAKHEQPLPEPVAGGKPWQILRHLAIRGRNTGLLVLAWLVVALCPTVPVPMLIFTGGQGSAKTTRSRRARSLLDPSCVPLLGEIDARDLMQIFHHHAVPCFENVANLTRPLADVFCRVVTGSGIERRKLYTDSEELIFSFRRPIIFNGIDVPSDRPDFRDRCLVLTCSRITNFQPLAALDAQFEQARPALFGALLDLLVTTFALLDSTPSTGEFRMADFAHFGRAVARALGMAPKDFDEAYRENLGEHSSDIVEDSHFALAVREVAKTHTIEAPWSGNSHALLKLALETAKEQSIPTKDFPRSPRWASTRLREVAPALRAEGVIVEQLRPKNNCRPWLVYTLSKAPAEADAKAQPTNGKKLRGGRGK